MKVEIELHDYILLVAILFHYEELLTKQLSLHHTAKEKEALNNKITKVSKFVLRIEAQAEQVLNQAQDNS